MDELKDQTKIELKETAAPIAEALIPVSKAFPDHAEESKFQSTQAMVRQISSAGEHVSGVWLHRIRIVCNGQPSTFGATK